MHIGLTFFPTDTSISPADLARAAEERGFESIWLAEHSHIPVGPMTPGPPPVGEPGLPREYYAAADPFVALAMAAAVTTTLKLATGICLVPQRDVFQTAKQVASLDLYSEGRFIFGVGGGWNQPEIENHGTPHAQRFAILWEKLAAMKELWTQEKAEYHGKYVDFGPSYAWPKPFQRPHPPIHVGGDGLRAIRRAVKHGQGWCPVIEEGVEDPVALLPEVQKALATAGRKREDFEVSIYFCPSDPDTVSRYRDAGIDRVMFATPSHEKNAALAALDSYAEFVA